MAQTAARLESLRFNRREIRRLGLVLGLSLLAPLLLWGGYEAARELQVWRWSPRPGGVPPPAKKDPAGPKAGAASGICDCGSALDRGAQKYEVLFQQQFARGQPG